MDCFADIILGFLPDSVGDFLVDVASRMGRCTNCLFRRRVSARLFCPRCSDAFRRSRGL